MLSALDPLGLPIATQIVSGERADDQLYLRK
jgi:transposase